jgi:hypothetical protein
MSILDNKIYNPAKFYEWSGSKGALTTYNKNSKENDLVNELEFIVLDQAATIKGWDDSSNSGYWSNEVKSSSSELIVRNKKGIVAKGTYADIKGTPGLKFCKVVYAYDTKTNEVIGLLFYGSSVTVAIDAKIKDGAKYKLTQNKELQKKGSNKYYVPIIDIVDCPTDELETAKEAYATILKPYLDEYYATDNTPKTDNNVTEMEEVHLRDIDLDNINVQMPF